MYEKAPWIPYLSDCFCCQLSGGCGARYMAGVDCFTGLALWHQDCQWDIRHGLQFTGITLLWLASLNIGWDCLNPNGLWARVTSGNAHPLSGRLTVLLYSPNGREMCAVRVVQGVHWKSLLAGGWQWKPSPLHLWQDYIDQEHLQSHITAMASSVNASDFTEGDIIIIKKILSIVKWKGMLCFSSWPV